MADGDKPRVLLGGMTANAGGKESFILSVFEALRHDYECWFLTDREIYREEEIVSAGGIIARVTPRGSSPLAYLRDLKTLFEQTRFDVVWMNQTVVNSLEPLWFARRRGVPVRALHSHSSRNMGGRLTGVLHHLQRPFVGQVANRSYACSEPAAKWFFRRRPYVFVPNFFDVAKFSYQSRVRSQVRTQLQLSPDAVVLTQVAHFGAVKNHGFTLKVLEHLVEMGVKAQLLFVGEGPQRSQIEQEVRNRGLAGRVMFLGMRDDVDRLLQASDALLLPSFFEGLPYVALEAQASGLPTVLSTSVTREVALTPLAQFVSLEAGATAWAARVMAVVHAVDRERAGDPLSGSPFDIRQARATLHAILARPNEESRQ